MQQVTSAQAGTVLGVIGPSGSGKTTLLEFLVTELAARGLRVNVIKHSHHDLELEPPRKDSARFRQAGAADVMVASPFRYAIVHELRGAPEPTLAEQVARLAPADLTLVEGFKREAIPKLEVWRAATGKPVLAQDDPHIVAVASTESPDLPLPCFNLDQPAVIAAFILDFLENDA